MDAAKDESQPKVLEEAHSEVTADLEAKTDSRADTNSTPPRQPLATDTDETAAHASLQVEQLQAIFPDQQQDVLEAVLAANGNDVVAATDNLLAMSDPSFKPEGGTDEQSRQDEDYARALMLEEQELMQRQHQQRQHQQQQPQPPLAPGELPYKPYVPRRRPKGPSSDLPTHDDGEPDRAQSPNARDELDQLSEQFSKLAEQGKRQFGVLFGKAKEQVGKFNEAVNQQRESQSTSGAPPPPPKFDPNASGFSRPTDTVQPSQIAQPVSSSVVPEPLPRPRSSPSREASLGTTPATSSRPESASGVRPSDLSKPSESDEPRRDFSKIGLLPRQSVSLLDQKNAKKRDNNHDDEDDDDDELEYVRSPFDDD